MSAQRKFDQPALIDRGKKQVTAKKLQAALELFKQAVLVCDCNKSHRELDRKRGASPAQRSLPVCYCKDFASLPTDDGDKLAIYRLAKKPCTCGSGVLSCKSKHHVAALNCISAVHESLKDYKQAYRSASLLVIAAPHVPEGYLRMAKALQLKDPSNKLKTKDLCLWIMTQGTTSVQTYGDRNHKLLKAFASLTRKDYLPCLPPEIQAMILGHLATAELCRILRVSKAWNYVSRNRDLWRRLDVIPSKRTKRQRKFPASIFQNLVFKLSQYQATSLTIKGLGDFDLDHHKLQSLLEALPRLQNLSLYGFGNVTKSPSFCGNHALSAVMLGAHACLRTLHLEDFGLSQGPLNPPIESSQPPRFIASLEELTLIDLKHFGPGKGLLSMYIWPRLEKLVVNNFDLQVGTEAPHACLLVRSTPALKDLSTNESLFRDPRMVGDAWPVLERLRCNSFQGLEIVPRSLRSLDLEAEPMRMQHHFPHGQGSELISTKKFEKLEHFRFCYDNADHIELMPLIIEPLVTRLQPSCDSGTFRSLHVTFNRDIRDAFDQVLNKNVIETLSCYDITMPSTFDGNGSYGGDVDNFVDWVRTFPALTTLGVYPSRTGQGGMVVARVIRERPDIKTIYTNALHGVHYDHVLEYATAKGVKIVIADRVPEPVLKPLPAVE